MATTFSIKIFSFVSLNLPSPTLSWFGFTEANPTAMKIWILSIGNNLVRWKKLWHMPALGDNFFSSFFFANVNSFTLRTCVGSTSLVYSSPKNFPSRNHFRTRKAIRGKIKTNTKGNESQTSHRPITLNRFYLVSHKIHSSVFALIHSSNCDCPGMSQNNKGETLWIFLTARCLLKRPVVKQYTQWRGFFFHCGKLPRTLPQGVVMKKKRIFPQPPRRKML